MKKLAQTFGSPLAGMLMYGAMTIFFIFALMLRITENDWEAILLVGWNVLGIFFFGAMFVLSAISYKRGGWIK
jgi:hypothetical protein